MNQSSADPPDPADPAEAASWYVATGNPAPRHPPLEGENGADIAILGAGYTGLSAALALAERGYRVAVVEAARVGWGASGRNGGQLITGFNPSFTTLAARHGIDDARALFALAEAGKAQLRARIARHGIACDLTWGFVAAALKPRQIRELAEEAALLQRFGYAELEPWSGPQLRAVVRSDRYIGGMHDRGSGHLHPLNYARGLAGAATAAGARLFERSPVVRLDPGPRPALVTARGRLTADFVLLCGNAHLIQDQPGLAPSLTRRIMPVASAMIATAPLGPDGLAAHLTRSVAVADANHILDYFRGTPDGRLLFGGLARYDGRPPQAIARALRPRLARVFPDLATVAIEHQWSGLVAITRDRLPYVGRLAPNILFALGYSGHGVILAGLAGALLAEAVAGTLERFDRLARLRHPVFPGGPLKTSVLRAAMLYYRLRDLV
jgi:gamma-glutamylputrescine oxidase